MLTKNNIHGNDLTFHLGQFGIQREIDLSSADAHQFTLVALHITEFSDKLFQNVIGVLAHEIDLRGHELVNGKDIGHLNVQSWFGLGVKIVELINVKVGLRILDRNDCSKLVHERV